MLPEVVSFHKASNNLQSVAVEGVDRADGVFCTSMNSLAMFFVRVPRHLWHCSHLFNTLLLLINRKNEYFLSEQNHTLQCWF